MMEEQQPLTRGALVETIRVMVQYFISPWDGHSCLRWDFNVFPFHRHLLGNIWKDLCFGVFKMLKNERLLFVRIALNVSSAGLAPWHKKLLFLEARLYWHPIMSSVCFPASPLPNFLGK